MQIQDLGRKTSENQDMKLNDPRIKFTSGNQPYWEYWCRGIKPGNRRKGYWCRCVQRKAKCQLCEKEYYVSIHRINKTKFCSSECRAVANRGSNNSNWKGGRNVDRQGYVHVVPPKEHPLSDVRGYVLEHRLVMERKLGRHLEKWEVIHHINHKRGDNRIENLELFPNTHPLDSIWKLVKENKRLKCLLRKHGISYL